MPRVTLSCRREFTIAKNVGRFTGLLYSCILFWRCVFNLAKARLAGRCQSLTCIRSKQKNVQFWCFLSGQRTNGYTNFQSLLMWESVTFSVTCIKIYSCCQKLGIWILECDFTSEKHIVQRYWWRFGAVGSDVGRADSELVTRDEFTFSF